MPLKNKVKIAATKKIRTTIPSKTPGALPS